MGGIGNKEVKEEGGRVVRTADGERRRRGGGKKEEGWRNEGKRLQE